MWVKFTIICIKDAPVLQILESKALRIIFYVYVRAGLLLHLDQSFGMNWPLS